jgi:hypothetical protein
MRLMNYALAVGIGYLLGRSGGGQGLAQVRRQAVGLTQRPAVQRVRGRVMARSKTADIPDAPATPDAPDASDASGGTDAAPAVDAAPARPRLRRAWRRPFSRSSDVHFPPSQGAATPAALGGTTVIEDSEAARLGMPAASPRTSSDGG